MNTSTKTLPKEYVQSGEINLKKNKRLALELNIAGVFVFIFSFLILLRLVTLARPSLLLTSFSITVGTVVVPIVLMVLLMTIHESIHGFFIWVFTRSRPVFAIRLFYGYAGAPAWYIPIRQYIFNALGPLIIIDAVGVLLMLLVPENWVLAPVIVVAMNTGGSIGDLLVLKRLCKLSPTSLVNDTGDAVTFYEQLPSIRHS